MNPDRLQRSLTPILNTLNVALGKAVCAKWALGEVKTNWGDNLNPYLISRLSNRRVIHKREVLASGVHEIYGVIGSWLAKVELTNIVVWGLGFIRTTDHLFVTPKTIIAVRGFHTIKKLRQQGLKTDLITVGDPALLMPLFYNVNKGQQRFTGVIPQHRDRHLPIFESIGALPNFKVIDICSGIEEFCDQIADCQNIVSSSLHAVVAAHAFKIPARLVKVSNNPLGDGFKLLDYLSTIGLEEEGVFECTTESDIRRAADSAKLPKFFPDMAQLISSCPFIARDRERQLLEKASSYYKL